MQLPLSVKIYLVGCPDLNADVVHAALATYQASPAGIAPELEAYELVRSDTLDPTMHGYALFLGDESQLDQAKAYLADTAVAALGFTAPASELVRLGFADVLPADANDAQLTATTLTLIRLALLRRRLDIRTNAFETYYRISDNMLWTKDMRDYHMDVNHYLTTLTGKPLDTIEGKHEVEVYGLDPDDPGCGESDRIVRETGEENHFEETMPDSEGMRHHLSVVKAPWFDGQGRIVGTIGIGKDTTELLNQLAKFDTFLNSIGLAVVITDVNTRLIQANSTFYALCGNNKVDGELITDVVPRYMTRVSESAGPTLVHLHKDADEVSKLEGDYAVQDSDGTVHIWDLDRFYLTNYWGDHTGFTYILQDVTDDRKQRSAIQKMAITDALTGTSNRAGMYAVFDTFAQDDHAMFMFIDIDNFKQINDGLGHTLGDRYLCEISELLKQALPESHITRYGGDEFFVVVPGMHSTEEANQIAHWILNQVRELPSAAILPACTGSLSMGIVVDAIFGEGVDSIIQRCDTLMYEAKHTGKNRSKLA